MSNGPVGLCRHVWIPKKSTGEEVKAACRSCGQKRTFSNWSWRDLPQHEIAPGFEGSFGD